MFKKKKGILKILVIKIKNPKKMNPKIKSLVLTVKQKKNLQNRVLKVHNYKIR